MASGAERRKYPRSRRPVTLASGDAAGILNHVDNISANGVLCHTQEPVALMTRMRIGLELPEPVSRTIEAEGVTVRCEPDGQGDQVNYKVAILFTKLDDGDHEAIRRFVEHDLAKPGAIEA